MNPERGPDPEEPLDIEDDLFADELCDYMTQLDLGGDNADDSAIKAEIPAELQSTISECRSILDFLHETRSQSSVSAPHTPSIESFSGFTIPVQIGRFKIIQRLGFGGYGVVFRGFDSESGRDVAIKVPRPELLESAELIYRFAREASIVAQLAHPNIVSIYESDCYGVVPYIVMAFIPGKTLSEWRQTESAPSPRIVATIARDSDGFWNCTIFRSQFRAHANGRDDRNDAIYVARTSSGPKS